MPATSFNLPNIITISRFLLSPVFFILFLIGEKEAALVVFTYVAVSDFADGWIARKHKQESALGKALDPLADKFMMLLVTIIMVMKFNFPTIAVPIFLARDIISFFGALILHKKTTRASWKVNKLGKITTFLQIITALSFLLNIEYKNIFLIITSIISLISALNYSIRGISIYKSTKRKP